MNPNVSNSDHQFECLKSDLCVSLLAAMQVYCKPEYAQEFGYIFCDAFINGCEEAELIASRQSLDLCHAFAYQDDDESLQDYLRDQAEWQY